MNSSLEFVLPFGIEQLKCAFVIRFRHKHRNRPAEVLFRRGGAIEFLSGSKDAMLFKHNDQKFIVDERTSVEFFHRTIYVESGAWAPLSVISR